MDINIEQTYDYICFTDLAHEFDHSNKIVIEKKIKRRLKYHQLGTYDQDRVDYLRHLKNDLYAEISLTTKSKYFQKSESDFADLDDFDFYRMTADFKLKYDKISIRDLQDIINFSIYLYHLR